MQDIVITGATGFLGRNLAESFLKRGDRVWALVRPGSSHLQALPVHQNLRVVLSGMDEVEKSAEEIGRADAFFHFAWGGVNREEIDSPEVQKQNIEGSVKCLTAAYRLGCRVFMDAGSRVEYGVTDQIMTEDMECHPINEYGKAKLEFFRQAKPLCEKFGMSYCHLRFFSVYGCGDHPWSFISTLIARLLAGEKVSLSACRHRWNFMYIDDAVEAVVRLYDSIFTRPGQVSVPVNIASRDTRVLREFAEEVREIIGGEGSLEYGTFQQAKEGALSICPDLTRLEALAGGFTERFTFRQGITATINKEMEQDHEENQRVNSVL